MDYFQEKLFDELDAFDPKWAIHYDRVKDAVAAAAVETPYLADVFAVWLASPEGINYTNRIASVRDVKGEVEAAQQAEQDSPEFRSAMGRLNAQADGVSYR